MSEAMLDDSFLDVEEPAEVAEVEVVTETEEPEPQEAEEAAPEVADKDTPEGETTAPEKQDWTLSAVMDEREKRQKAVREAEELRKELEALRKPQEDVSVFEDEKGFVEQLKKQTAQELRNTAFNMSQAFAEETFGEEKVAQAQEWYKSEGVKSPYVVDQVNNAKLPYHALIKVFEAEQQRQNPESLRAQLKAEILAELKTSQPQAEPVTPSLASSRSAGNTKETVESFEDILGD